MHGLLLLAHDCPVKLENAQAEVGVGWSCFVGDDVDGEASVLNVGRDKHRAVEAPRVVLEGLPASIVVNARPRSHGPAIVQLPEDGAHSARAAAAKVLGAYLDALGLEHLADVQE